MPRRLSDAQNERLREYIEQELLSINRRYLRRINPDSEPGTRYDTIPELLQDLNKIIDLIWYSLSNNSSDVGQNTFQTTYFLRIADSLNDYIVGFEDKPAPLQTLETLSKLDLIFSRAISLQMLTKTEQVRLSSIIERSRVLASSFVVELNNEDDETSQETHIGSVYEKTLTRIGNRI